MEQAQAAPLSQPAQPAQPAQLAQSEQSAPTTIVGVGLPARINLFSAGGGFTSGRGPVLQPAHAVVASAASGPDPAALAWRAELMATLMQQLQGERAAAPTDARGRCIADDAPPRLRCDHAEAEAALGGEAGHTIATLLNRLAALDLRPAPPAVAYAEGRFRVEWR